MSFAPLPTRRTSRSPLRLLFFVLLFAGLTQSATSWAAETLSAIGSPMSSEDVIFRQIESVPEGKITHYLNQQLQALPRQLSRVRHQRRPLHVYLILDFHRDCSYSKKAPRGTTKGPVKNSTSRAWSYLVAELLIGTRKQVVAMVLRHQGESIANHVARLFAELPSKIHFRAVIVDGEFATTDTLRFFKERGILFLARCPARGYLKGITRNAGNTPEAKARRFWIGASIQNKNHQDAFFEATWEWTPGGPRLLIKSPEWHLTITAAEELYGRRFNIETGFRDTHLFQPRTNTSNISVRLALVFTAIVWWNVYEYSVGTRKHGTTRKDEWISQVRTFRLQAFYQMSAMAVAAV